MQLTSCLKNLHCGLATLALAALLPSAVKAEPMLVGTNLGAPSYYDGQIWANLMKNASSWAAIDATTRVVSGDLSAMTRDAEGYPARVPFGDNRGVLAYLPVWENGVHVIKAEGVGTLVIAAPGVPLQTLTLTGGTFTHTINIAGAKNVSAFKSASSKLLNAPSRILLYITRSVAGNNVRHIRVMRPGYDANQEHAWDDGFLAKLDGFDTLRFMDWQKTNESDLTAASQVPSRIHFTQASNLGVSWDLMIDLCNLKNKNAWICVPHQFYANPGAINAMADAWKRLEAGRFLFVEYSNEVWNSGQGFEAYPWVRDNVPGGSQPVRYGRAAKLCFERFHQVFGAQDSSRVLRVVAGQAGFRGVMEGAVSEMVSSDYDRMAIAPYCSAFSNRLPSELPTVAELLTATTAQINGAVANNVTNHINFANSKGKVLICYEGGCGYKTYGNDAYTNRLAEFNRSGQAYTLYRSVYLPKLKQLGLKRFMQFNQMSIWGESGFWGSAEYATQPVTNAVGGARKMRAIRDWNEFNNP
jgi:hypothetical protein